MTQQIDDAAAAVRRVRMADQIADLAMEFLADLLAGRARIEITSGEQFRADAMTQCETVTSIRLVRDQPKTEEPI